MNKNKKLLTYKLCLFLIFTLIIILSVKYLSYISKITVSVTKFNNYILSLGSFGSIFYILFQAVQTIIAPIPIEVIQIAGGYIYGIPLGTIYSTLGLALGSAIAFYFTRTLGSSFVEKILYKKKSQWILNIMNSKKFSIILFIVFFIPGLPKDFLIYVAGLTPIKPLKFFEILFIGRFPSLLATVSIGSNLHNGNYASTIIISIIFIVSLVLGILYKDKLINKFSENNNL